MTREPNGFLRAPTLKDVARKAGVGVATASTVLNGGSNATRVSESTRKRIREVAAELRYHPNAVARGLRSRRTRTIGVLFDNRCPLNVTHNPHTSAILEGILLVGRSEGYNVLAFTSQWENAETSAAMFRDSMTDGVLVIAPRRSSDIVDGLSTLGIPVVTVSGPSGKQDVPCVDIDHAAGATLVADHFATLGHQRIAYQGGDEDSWSTILRGEAFWQRLATYGIRYRPEYALPGTFLSSEAQRQIELLLRREDRPTAVFATNDQLALGVLLAARKVGLSVPEELSIVGFDNNVMSAYTNPPLTSVHHPMVEIGKKAMQILLQRLEGQMPEVVAQTFAPSLVLRGSTAAAPVTP